MAKTIEDAWMILLEDMWSVFEADMKAECPNDVPRKDQIVRFLRWNEKRTGQVLIGTQELMKEPIIAPEVSEDPDA